MIYDQDLNYQPVLVYTELPICIPKPRAECTEPPKTYIMEKFISFGDKNVHDLLFLEAASILAIYSCKQIISTFNLRKLAVKEPRMDVRALKLSNSIVNSNYSDCMHFLGYFVLHDVNKISYLANALAKGLMGPIILLSRLPEHNSILKFSHEIENRL